MGVYRSNRPWENVFIPRYSGFNAGENVLSNIKSNVLDFVYESLKISFFLLWLLKRKHGSEERQKRPQKCKKMDPNRTGYSHRCPGQSSEGEEGGSADFWGLRFQDISKFWGLGYQDPVKDHFGFRRSFT